MKKKLPPKSTSTKFQKGQSGNPLGRPKKLPSLDRLLGEILNETDKSGVSKMHRIILKLVAQAIRGNVRASELLLDRCYGKVKVAIGVTTENPVEIFLNMSPEQKEEYIKKFEGHGE